MLQLIVEAAHNSFRRARLIVLDESVCDSEFGKLCLMVGLQEIAARITVNSGAKFDDAGERCFLSLQENQNLTRLIEYICAPIDK